MAKAWPTRCFDMARTSGSICHPTHAVQARAWAAWGAGDLSRRQRRRVECERARGCSPTGQRKRGYGGLARLRAAPPPYNGPGLPCPRVLPRGSGSA